MCVCLWFSVLLYVYVVVSVSVPIKRKRLYESPRAVTRLTVYRPRRVNLGTLFPDAGLWRERLTCRGEDSLCKEYSVGEEAAERGRAI